MRTDDSDVAPGGPAISRRPFVIGGVVGFLVGLLVMGLLWAGAASGSGATEDARAACGALDRAGPLPDGFTAPTSLAPGVIQHLTAARDLSSAAAEQNPVYQALADHLGGVSRMAISLNFADPGGRRDLTLARQLCARL